MNTQSVINEAMSRIRLFDKTDEQITHVVIEIAGDAGSPDPYMLLTVIEDDNGFKVQCELRKVTNADIEGLTEQIDNTEKAVRALGIFEVISNPFESINMVCAASLMDADLKEKT